ncbi:MAG: patatin-like phospholipase family protein [Proteobacteria bacterium]|nr:patatin-like phospholipase family protein [Pseudomonadota bacterium]
MGKEVELTVEELKNKRIGVVFSSGFFGFFAHAGCLKALEELGIKPVGYAGTSSGAIAAAFAAAGLNAERISAILFNLRKQDFWDPEPWYKTAVSALKLFRGSLGYLEGERFRNLLERNLPVRQFHELTTPCVIVGANITKKRREVFTAGSISDAVQASGTIPWTFKMKKIGDDYFLDGGLIDKAPLDALRAHVPVDVILVHYIASHDLTENSNSFLLKKFSPQRAYGLAISIARHEHYQAQKKLAEQQGVMVIELKPDLPPVTPDSLQKGREAFNISHKYVLEYFHY